MSSRGETQVFLTELEKPTNLGHFCQDAKLVVADHAKEVWSFLLPALRGCFGHSHSLSDPLGNKKTLKKICVGRKKNTGEALYCQCTSCIET